MLNTETITVEGIEYIRKGKEPYKITDEMIDLEFPLSDNINHPIDTALFNAEQKGKREGAKAMRDGKIKYHIKG